MVSSFTTQKGLFRNLEFLCLFLLLSSVSFGQLAGGTYTIDGTLVTGGTNYHSFTDAITALNTGITGPVTFNVVAGQTFTENPPAINIPSGNTSSNPVIFQNSGGTDPVISYTGGTSGALDGIIVLSGTSYITFDGINLTDASSTNYAEWGYALLKQNSSAPFNGCQNVTIKNCTISMNKANANLSYGIYSGNHTSALITSLTLTTATDAMNNCKFQNNTISNVFAGIYLYGFNYAPVPYTLYDQNNEISGNTISDVGGTAGAGTKCSKGIFTAGQNNFIIKNNIIDNTASSTAYAITDSLIGIYSYAGATTGIGVNVTISNNVIALRSASTNKTLMGIYNLAGNNGTSNTININNNTIQNFTTSCPIYGIYNVAGNNGIKNPININYNTIQNCSTSNVFYGIYNTAGNTGNSNPININNNILQYCTIGNTVWGLYNTGGNSGFSNRINIQNNTVQNFIISTASGFNGLYNTGGSTGTLDSVYITGDTVRTCTMGAASFGIISNESSNYCNISSNVVQHMTLGDGAWEFDAIKRGTSITNYWVVNNNTIDTITKATTTSTYTPIIYGINLAGSNLLSVYKSNIVHDITVSGTSTTTTSLVYGIAEGGAELVDSCYGNSVYNLTLALQGATGGFTFAAGNTANGYKYISNNLIHDVNITTTGTTASNAYGINLTQGSYAYYIQNNKIYNLSAGGTAGKVYGITTNASGYIYYIYNNVIANLTAPASVSTGNATPVSLQGIVVNSAAGGYSYVYNNTIYLNATSTSTTNFSTQGIFFYTGKLFELRNNIIVNTSTPKGTGKAVVVDMDAATFTNYSQNSNNNCYYAGTPSAWNLIFSGGNSNIWNMTNFRDTSVFTKAEANSFSELPPFIDPVNNNFNISTSTPTLCEKGGAPISTPVAVTTDIAGTTRDANFPDAGAYEFAGTQATDIIAPRITFTPLLNTNSTSGVTLTATIKDPSGVPTSGSALPVLYWKIGAGGTYTAATGSPLGGSLYSFNFGTASAGNTIYYYFCTQDSAATPNAQCYPLAGTAGISANPPAVSTPPTTPWSFAISGSLSGTFNVGPGGDYTTLTAAVAAYNASVISGPVTFVLNSSYVGTTASGETFPIVINKNPGASATNVLTIKPGTTGLSITGATITTYPYAPGAIAQALIIFYGTQYATIDGSSNGTTSRDLTIHNTSTTGTANQQVIAVESLGAKQGASQITIKNCTITGGLLTSSGTIGIAIGGIGVSSASLNGQDISNISVTNNKISFCYMGIALNAEQFAYEENITINNNTIGDATLANSISDLGLALAYTDHLTISNNEIFNITNSSDMYCCGMYAYQVNPNLTINNNYIHNISGTKTTATQYCDGMYFNLSTNTAYIYNNIIYSVKAVDYGTTGVNGIYVNNPWNSKIYYNTIVLTGTENGSLLLGNNLVCLYISGNAPYGVGMDLRDNILINTLTPYTGGAANSYTLYVSTGIDPSFFDYNDYFTLTGGHFYIGNWGGTNYSTLSLMQNGVYGGFNLKSVSENVNFTSNYRLSGSSNGDILLTGIPVPGITTDIDGNPRNPYGPYMGASEGSVLLPVELSSFTSYPNGRDIVLNWETKTEKNSDRFEVERSVFGLNNWNVAGYVKAANLSNSPRQYLFTDKNLQSGKYQYRIKMIDNNGTFEYSKIVETEITVPKDFSLSQNYPNPFNPSTKIDYQLPVNANVKIELYNITGQKVANIVNEDQSAGYYTIEVGSGSMHKNLASGVYIYRLTAINKQTGANFNNVKKMIVLK